MGFKEASYWRKVIDKKVNCFLCPHNCLIDNGEVGICKARMNIVGKLKSLNYGKVYESSYKKIEELNIFHFLPGKEVLKVIIPGDNLKNKITESVEYFDSIPSLKLNPVSIFKQGQKSEGKAIVFLGEPIIGIEFVNDVVKKGELKYVFHSRGFVNEKVMKEVAGKFNLGVFEIFSMRGEFYENIFRAKLEDVLRAVELFHSENKMVEIKMPLIDNLHKDFYDIRKLISWILNNLGKEVVLSFINVNASQEILERARKVALDAGMEYVYTSSYRDTICPNCKRKVILRGENTKVNLKKGKCFCGKEIPGIWR